MSEAAAELDVTNHAVRRLIRDGPLPAEQVVPGALYQIRAANLGTADLGDDRIAAALRYRGRPRRAEPDDQIPMFPYT